MMIDAIIEIPQPAVWGVDAATALACAHSTQARASINASDAMIGGAI